MKKKTFILALLAYPISLCMSATSYAQKQNSRNIVKPIKGIKTNNGNPKNEDINGNHTSAPFGGALSLLVAAGAAVSLKRAKDKKKLSVAKK